MNYGIVELTWEKCPGMVGSPNGAIRHGRPAIGFDAWGHIDWATYDASGKTSYNSSRIVTDRTHISRVFRSDHPGGAQFVFVDGSVHFVPETIDYPVLRALVTRAGEESNYKYE